MTFNTACNRRLPFVSPFTAPPDFFVTSRPELLRLFIVIAFFTPLSSNFRIKRCKIILYRNCQAASAVRAAVSLAAIAHARSPGMSFLTPPPIAVIVKGCHIHWRLTIVQIAGPLLSQFRINDRQACLLRNQTVLFTIWTSRTICPVIRLCFPDVPFITHPKIRFRAMERHLLRQSFAVLIITPLCGKFRCQRFQIVKSAQHLAPPANRAPALHAINNPRLPFMPQFTLPPYTDMGIRRVFIRLFVLILYRMPLSCNLRCNGPQIRLSRDGFLTITIGAAFSVHTMADLRLPLMLLLAQPPHRPIALHL